MRVGGGGLASAEAAWAGSRSFGSLREGFLEGYYTVYLRVFEMLLSKK